MLQKVKSLLTSAHCEEWDNEMQNQSRTQALFACLSQALSEEKVPSLRKLLSHFWVLFMQRTWSWAWEGDAALIHCGSRAKPGTFLPHSLCISVVHYVFCSRICSVKCTMGWKAWCAFPCAEYGIFLALQRTRESCKICGSWWQMNWTCRGHSLLKILPEQFS